MSTIAELMTHDHRACDHDFARAETLAAKADWSGAAEALDAFARALNAHFDAEEQHLFPAFEAATGMTHGPTHVMRGEHRDMREALDRLQEALRAQDADDFARYSNHSARHGYLVSAPLVPEECPDDQDADRNW